MSDYLINNDTKEELIDFFKNTDDFLIIDGGAGSGKTSAIAWALNYCDQNNLTTNAVSYTGKASSILRDKTKGRYGQTIHLFLYQYDYDIDEEEIEPGKPERIRRLNTQPVDVLFVDEASMLSKNVKGFQVGEDVRDTYLLDELIFLQCKSNSKKIVFVGDHRQLDPVEKEDHHDSEEKSNNRFGDESQEFVSQSKLFSDALNENVLNENYGLRGSSFYCTENYRNKGDSNVFSIFGDLAAEITGHENIEYSPADWIKEKYPKFILSSEEEAFNWLKEKRDTVGWAETRVVTGFNSSVDEMNAKIRLNLENLTGEVGEYQFDSTHPLMNLRNRHFIEIYNGDTFFINEVLEEDYKKTNEDNDELESFKISRIDLQLKRKLGSSQRVLMMNELINLEQARRDIDDRYNLNFWHDFVSRHPEIEDKKDSNWYQLLREDEIMNTLLVVHAFASTVHKAQGDEFEYVLVDLDNEQFSLKWLYTAVTRAKSEVRFLISS